MWINLLDKYCRCTRRGKRHIDMPLLVVAIYVTCCLDSLASGTLLNFQPRPNYQRRFMWRQMTHGMDDFVDDVVSGARSVLGGMLQPGAGQQTLSPNEYLSSETTRVKYIIRDPHTNKPMKIIKMGPQKKLIRFLNRPLIAANSNSKGHKYQKELQNGAPIKSAPKQELEKPVHEEQHDVEDQEDQDDGDIVGGKIHDLDASWKPMGSEAFKKPYANIKSYPMSQLHTNVMGDGHDASASSATDDDDDFASAAAEERHRAATHIGEVAPRRPHMYEVTEYVAEESVALAQSKNFSSRNSNYEPPPIPMRQAYKSSFVTVPPPPPPAPIRSTITRAPTTTTTTSTTTTSRTITTAEPPNYPAAFLSGGAFGGGGRKSSAFSQVAGSSNYKRVTPTEDNIWLPLNHTLPSPLAFRMPGGAKPVSSYVHSTVESVLPPLTSIDRIPTLARTQQHPVRPVKAATLPPAVARITPTATPPPIPSTTTARPFAARPKPMITKYTSPSEKLTAISTSLIATTPKSMRYRGTVKFGDKLNWE